MGVKEETAEIRKLVKQHVPTVSVTMAKGTSYGWVEIEGSGKYGRFTPEELRRLRRLGFSPAANSTGIPPSERKKWITKLKNK